MDLFQYADAFARRRDPATSKAAAASISPTPLEAAVYGALLAHGPMTTHELSEVLRLSLVTVSPRLRPMADRGLVEDSGTKRLNPSGRQSIVWKVRTP